ncbi:MAG: hypothetical protein WBW36_19425, partial [Candidatus Sulfotelmatobacter sp.]
MKRWILRGLVLLVVVAGLYFAIRHLGVSRTSSAGGFGVHENSMAPDFSLPNLTGQKLDLSSYR